MDEEVKNGGNEIMMEGGVKMKEVEEERAEGELGKEGRRQGDNEWIRKRGRKEREEEVEKAGRNSGSERKV